MIKDGEPVVLVEAKAVYSFDAVNPATPAKYEGNITKDIAKAEQLAMPETQIMVAAFMTHAAALVPADLDGVVKYRSGINKTLDEYPDPQEHHAHAVEVLQRLGMTQQVIPSPRPATVFGIPVQVDAWVTHADP